MHTRVPAEGNGHVATKRRDNRSRAFPSSLSQLAPFPFSTSPRQPRQLSAGSSPPICQVDPGEEHPVEPRFRNASTFPRKNETPLFFSSSSRKVSPSLSRGKRRGREREREKRSHRGRSCTARRKESGSSRLARPNEIEAKILERDRIDVATDDNRNRIFADSSSAACVRSEKRRRAERRFHEYDRRHGGTPVFHRRISRARSVHDGVRAEIHPTLGTRVPSTPGPLHLAPSLLFGRRNTASRENGGSRPDARVDARGRYV